MSRPVSHVFRHAVVAVLVGTMLNGGCVRTVTKQVARYEPAGVVAPTTQSVKYAAVWKVKVRERGDEKYRGIDGTERWLQPGDSIGFRTGDDGVVYAVANKESIPLALNEKHRQVVWQMKRKETTDFGESLTLGLQFTGVVVGSICLTALALYAFTHPTTDDCQTSHD